MPWKECTVMSSRREVVELARQGTVPVRELSRRFEVSCKTIYKWMKRFKAQGVAGLVDQSRRPHSSSVRTPEKMEESVVQLRQSHPAWGGRKLRRRLKALGQLEVPSASTITEILRRRELLGQPGQQLSVPYQPGARKNDEILWCHGDHVHVISVWDVQSQPISTEEREYTHLRGHRRYGIGSVFGIVGSGLGLPSPTPVAD